MKTIVVPHPTLNLTAAAVQAILPTAVAEALIQTTESIAVASTPATTIISVHPKKNIKFEQKRINLRNH